MEMIVSQYSEFDCGEIKNLLELCYGGKREEEGKMTSFEIDALFSGEEDPHYAMIEVYGSKQLCNFIIQAVNEKLARE